MMTMIVEMLKKSTIKIVMQNGPAQLHQLADILAQCRKIKVLSGIARSDMEGIIRIEDYKVHCIIGAHAYEREEEQEISIDIELRTNFLECAQSDSIVDTIDYKEVAKVCRTLAEIRRYHLLETFAFEAVHALIGGFFAPFGEGEVDQKKSCASCKGCKC